MNQQPTFHATTWKLSPFITSCPSRASDALTSLIDWVIFGNYSILWNLTEAFFKWQLFLTHTVARKRACLFVLARPFRRIHWFVIKLNEAFDVREARTRTIKRFVQTYERIYHLIFSVSVSFHESEAYGTEYRKPFNPYRFGDVSH